MGKFTFALCGKNVVIYLMSILSVFSHFRIKSLISRNKMCIVSFFQTHLIYLSIYTANSLRETNLWQPYCFCFVKQISVTSF